MNKSTRYKQENIFELIKTELNYVKVLNITKRVGTVYAVLMYIHEPLNKIDFFLFRYM